MAANSSTSPSGIVFLLGAGASVPAGVPDSRAMVTEFRAAPRDQPLDRLLGHILDTTEGHVGAGQVDVEKLLEVLDKLRHRDDEPVLWFCTLERMAILDMSMLQTLVSNLKDFIKQRTMVTESSVQYLSPFHQFVDEFGSVDVVSLNYDTCIEQFCSSNRLVYQDGFDVHWNPTVFDDEHAAFRLYKLHGSVLWYTSDRGDYVKLPIKTGSGSVELITGEKAQNLMLYPAQKLGYEEPFIGLTQKVKALLESDGCQLLVVVGYSFRDEHIRRMLWDAARKNRTMTLVIVDPKARQIYEKQLMFYDAAQKVRSSVFGRVVCLQDDFRAVFDHLKNRHLKWLRDAAEMERGLRQAEARGERPSWTPYLKLLAQAEHTDRALQVANERIAEDDWVVPDAVLLEVFLRLTMSLIANGQRDVGAKYMKHVDMSVSAVFGRSGQAFVTIEPPNVVTVMFPMMSQQRKTLDQLRHVVGERKRIHGCIPRELMPLAARLELLAEHCKSFLPDDRVKLATYTERHREAHAAQVAEVDTALERFVSDRTRENESMLILALQKLETQVLQKLLWADTARTQTGDGSTGDPAEPTRAPFH